MANTYTLISSNVLSSSAASVTFSAIPSTYTDLVVRASIRSDRAAELDDWLSIQFGGSGFSQTTLQGNGATASSSRGNTNGMSYFIPAATATTNTFSSLELYVPNYAGSTQKPSSTFNALETNATTAYLTVLAGLRTSTSAISSISFTPYWSNLVAGSSFYLYGISKN